ncbi:MULTISPECIES: cyanase [Mycobacteriaceae]|uniref:Cyanate hydratase n=1 Tax=Mycolicibacterium neoaurum VKM Ac-1815D TaxID=700508 RepID=V5X7G9_MYCNE|nr:MULTISPECIES: cyanase [Mycobacteriaceae]AMO05011.1 cyanate hydratase [Mycolicibacterium neoaurum]AXK76677.1 cyanase [Mycolicibacterium neoaurum]KUM07733.1 cyanate hydratase [Mycolicibacterium neoaurum]
MAYDVASPVITEIEQRRFETGISWQNIADHIDRPLVWTVAALLGSHPMPAEQAGQVGELLGLSAETVAALQRQPYRTADPALLTDPTIYRFVELVNVYGPTFKALIHEEFGDGIMSAINCSVSFARRSDPDGDRVVLTIDGKFLPYHW